MSCYPVFNGRYVLSGGVQLYILLAFQDNPGAQSRVRNLMYEKLAKAYNIWCVTCDLLHVVQQ
jgi:hypothetical protein